MWIDAERFYNFYHTALGISVAKSINFILNNLWPKVDHHFILGIGYAQPYINQFMDRCDRMAVAMLSEQGAIAWPSHDNNVTLLVNESNLPFTTESVDKLLIVHSFEFSKSTNQLLYEAWRLLKPRGELILIVPDKRSVWSRSLKSPFGHGEAYSSYQIESLLCNFGFLKIKSKKALIYPPFEQEFVINILKKIEKLNSLYFNQFGGIIIIKAIKQIYGITPGIRQTWLPEILTPISAT